MKSTLQFLLACLVSSATAAEVESTVKPKRPELDTFASGQWKGLNAVYQAKNYDAFFTKDMVLRIQPKQDGKAVGPVLVVEFLAYYILDQRHVRRDLVSLDKKPAPAMQPRKIDLAGHYEEKVKFKHAITFSERGVTAEGDALDPAGIKHPTYYAYWVRFPASHEIPRETPEEEMKKATDGHSVVFFDAKRKKETFGYWQAVQSRGNGILEAEVAGAWGPRKISIEVPPTAKNARRIGTFWNYAVSRFYMGGWHLGRVAADKVEGGPLSVKIE